MGSNQRPDTLMQDRRRQFDEIFLQRAAGPYIWVKSAGLHLYQPLPFRTHLTAANSIMSRPSHGAQCGFQLAAVC
ncbi:hypothetical protein V1289_000685 [Bradyrhizobium sp. AZCC 2289]